MNLSQEPSAVVGILDLGANLFGIKVALILNLRAERLLIQDLQLLRRRLLIIHYLETNMDLLSVSLGLFVGVGLNMNITLKQYYAYRVYSDSTSRTGPSGESCSRSRSRSFGFHNCSYSKAMSGKVNISESTSRDEDAIYYSRSENKYGPTYSRSRSFRRRGFY